jgi:5-methyltetrahydropteroyltriglutamate--homocysteine methyltransferase
VTTSAKETSQPKLDLAILAEFSNKTIVFGILDLGDMQIESPQSIAGRLCEAFSYVPPELLLVAPDCGMKYLPRALASQKLWAMTLGAAIVKESID